ncbi:helix-turn-helix transcriptional regulator [Roseateles sp. DAIF2]|uniref:helix-turn-helix transcriptional regulator n=1 Tax=Roseateles sp. DAIF2 TaxID=2714952 RepID=UPI0018A31EFF|nr:helix-turn-helix transcriptional regulator [Roseateles sp. DAIF2]QPF75313.1 helix-turn-helix transcriptional regulator [Roseateles sp. DAIF2]
MTATPAPDADNTWHGTLTLGTDWALWEGTIGDTSVHRHFAAQAVLAQRPDDGPSTLAIAAANGEVLHAPALLIEPLQPHRLLHSASSGPARVVFIEPRRRPAASLPAEIRAALSAAMGSARMLPPTSTGFWSAWQADAGPDVPAEEDAWEATVRAAIDELAPQGAVALAEIARRVYLSPERLRHVFADRIGMNFRRFVLWRRLLLAGPWLQRGASITEAAHGAGFADAAHFARTLRSTFGLNASRARLIR